METITIKPNGRVYLTLPNKEYKPKRQIGYIRERTFHTFRKPENHFFRKLNAIGLNYKLLSMGGNCFDLIEVEFGFEILKTSRKYFLEHGEFLHFSKNKLDKQIFLKLDLFGMDRVKEWELQKALALKNKNENKDRLEKVVGKIENVLQEELF